MKRIPLLFAAVSMLLVSIVSCDKYDDTELRQRLEKLEGTTINNINQQIAAIENTIGLLQQADAGFSTEIGTLRTYVDECRNSDKSWIQRTYSTLEQYNALTDSIVKKDSLHSARTNNAVLSMQSWVNESLTGYYDIATANAKLAALEKKMKVADSTSTANIAQLHADLEQAKNDLTTAYGQAITSAINTNNGVINQTIASQIASVNTRIDNEVSTINLNIASLEGRIAALEEAVKEMAKTLGLSLTKNSILCSPHQMVTIGYAITNGSAAAAVYVQCENGWSAKVTQLTDSTGTIAVTAPDPASKGTLLVFLNDQNKSVIKALTVGGLEYVDLGLSVKWATFNVGAHSPTEYGDYFAWGETEPYYESGHAQDNPQNYWMTGKSNGYAWSSYKYCNGSYDSQTKYCTNSSYGTVDNKTILDLEDDAAHVNWGGDWRMPTKNELDELSNSDHCTWTWYYSGNTEFGGVAGYKVTSNKSGYEGNFIFLPAAGYRGGTDLSDVGSYGYYWSSSLSSSGSYNASYLYFFSGYRSASFDYRYYGRSVRPVMK